MKTIAITGLLVFLCMPLSVRAGFVDDLLKSADSFTREGLDDDTIIAGLKEALEVGTGNAVRVVSRVNGYFGNERIKIIMPEKIRTVADVMVKMGFEKDVNDFIKSMNRAAEKAAPKAVALFVDSIKEMSFGEARKILQGEDTAATEYFRRKTGTKLFRVFKPVIARAMDDVGVTRYYKEMIARYETVPFVETASIDLDRYVTNKALAGLFYMVGEEERKIRKDPAARVTELLRKVFHTPGGR